MKKEKVSFYYGKSYETSDFVVDCVEEWWSENKEENKEIEELVINLDNGPDQKSNRTQFMKRMVEFAKKEKIKIHLVYYPPYYSKYNPIEHVFGALEKYWNGIIMNTIDYVLKVTKNMTWKGEKPNSVKLIDKVYEIGISLSKKQMEGFQKFIIRSETIPKWDLVINPFIGI